MADGKFKAFVTDVKEHWNEPDREKGNYVPYKEYVQIFCGVAVNYAAKEPLNYISFGASCFLIMYHYDLPYLAFSIVGLIGLPLSYLWSVIGWIVADNLNQMSKSTERKIRTFYSIVALTGIALMVFDLSKIIPAGSALASSLDNLVGVSSKTIFKLIGVQLFCNSYSGLRNIFWRKKFLPIFGRYKYSLYSDVIMKCVMIVLIGWLPLYNIPNVDERFWLAYLMFSVYGTYNFSLGLQDCAYMCSPNAKERLRIRVYPVKISHLLDSVMGTLIPLLGSFEEITFFRWVLPGPLLPLALLTLILGRNIKERIPQPPLEKKKNIDMWYGISEVIRNKYRWVDTIANMLDAFGNGSLNIMTVIYLYTLRLSGIEYSLLTLFFTFRGTIPTFFAPFFIKRFSYRALKEFNQAIFVISTIFTILVIAYAGDNTTLCAFALYGVLWMRGFFEEIVKVAASDMGTRMGDYQMYLSGERLDSFSGVYGWFTSPITTVISLITPIILLANGFNSNWDILYLDSARFNILAVPLIFDLIGHILMMIPYAFWKYNNKEQEYIEKTLEQRAALAQAGYIPDEYEGGLNFIKPKEIRSGIPKNPDDIISQADKLDEELLEKIKMN